VEALQSQVLDPDPNDEDDDDPRCVCGVYLSEHALCGCPEGFQLPTDWEWERAVIRERAFREYDDLPEMDEAYWLEAEDDLHRRQEDLIYRTRTLREEPDPYWMEPEY